MLPRVLRQLRCKALPVWHLGGRAALFRNLLQQVWLIADKCSDTAPESACWLLHYSLHALCCMQTYMPQSMLELEKSSQPHMGEACYVCVMGGTASSSTSHYMRACVVRW